MGLGYAPINERLKAFLLVCTTLAKILVIASIFMHLRYERLNLILITFVPLILAIIMFSFTFPETLGTATHVIKSALMVNFNPALWAQGCAMCRSALEHLAGR